MFKQLNTKNGIYLMALLIVVQFLIYNYIHILQLPPTSVHSWRQSDCLSFALNFCNGRGTFLEPCLNNLGPSYEGKAATDFPIVQFVIGNIWKITGVNTGIFKLTTVIFLFFGLLFVYKLFMWATNQNIPISILGTLLINTSPNLAYYGVTTISDIHAVSLSFIGIYFFANWMEGKKTKHLILFILLYTLAGLLKASAAFSFLLCVSIYFTAELITVLKTKTVKPKQLIINSLLVLLPFLFWCVWFSYANSYNLKHPNGFFLIGILPIWDIASSDEVTKIFRALLHEKIFELFHPFILFSMLFAIISSVVFFIKKQPFYVGIILLSVIVFVLFILLFYQVFYAHDYYLINMTSVVFIIIITLILIINKYNKAILHHKYIKLILFLMVITFTFITSIKLWARINYVQHSSFNNMLLFDNEKTKLMSYYEWTNTYLYKIIENQNFKLEDYGISKTDTIICLGDYTINRSLYALNRVGYTSFNCELINLKTFLEEPKHKTIKYLVLIEPEWKDKEALKPYLTNKIFEKEATSIYKLK